MQGWIMMKWPDWEDVGRKVEIELPDGRTVQGELLLKDFFPNGTQDEVPLFDVQTRYGTLHDLAASQQWRFLHSLSV